MPWERSSNGIGSVRAASGNSAWNAVSKPPPAGRPGKCARANRSAARAGGAWSGAKGGEASICARDIRVDQAMAAQARAAVHDAVPDRGGRRHVAHRREACRCERPPPDGLGRTSPPARSPARARRAPESRQSVDRSRQLRRRASISTVSRPTRYNPNLSDEEPLFSVRTFNWDSRRMDDRLAIVLRVARRRPCARTPTVAGL